jgi:hypothetical protein
MGNSIGVAHDPSVADSVLSHEVRKHRRATSPRSRREERDRPVDPNAAAGACREWIVVTHETITMFSHNAREMRGHYKAH